MGTASLPETSASQGDPAQAGCTALIRFMGLTFPHINRPTGVSMEDEDILVKQRHQKTQLQAIASHLPYLLTTSLKCSMFRTETGIQIGR